MERRCLADGAVLENSSHSNFPLVEVSVSSNDRNGAEELHLSSHTILGSNNTGSQESTVNIDTPDGVKCESQDLNPQNKVFQSPAYQASPIAEYPSK